MAEDATVPAVVNATTTVEEPKQSADVIAKPAVAEPKPAEGGAVATSGIDTAPQTDAAQENTVVTQGEGTDAQADTTAVDDDADGTTAGDASVANGTPAAKKGHGKRKSISSVPEHKKKTPAKGKKKQPELRLNVSAGDMFMVAMRGYQPWPVIVCDEEMLPESLLSKRPVSAKRIDGTYREDYLDGGKNAKDRRYPVMFLGTNEFAWQVNTELLSFEIDEVKKDVESNNQGKKNKALWEAYHIAADGHDLSYFKQMLAQHEKAMQDDLEQREQKELAKKNKADKAAKRKSIAAEESDDVDMQDADGATTSAKKAKGAKKRKKGDESEGENEKAGKTPKTKLKLTTKTPKDASAKPKKETKGKKKPAEEEEPVVPEEPQLTEAERLQKREKHVLYLRHRLQKGFLSRSEAPKDEDMLNMSDYLKQLEIHDDLEAEIIKKTKVHKVLKAIIKLDSIPKEEEYNFKRRSNDLLGKWNGALSTETEPTSADLGGEPSTNGVKRGEEDKPEPAKVESSAEKPASAEKKGDIPTEEVAIRTATDKDGDVAMSEKQIIKDASAGNTKTVSTDSGAKVTTDAPTATAS